MLCKPQSPSSSPPVPCHAVTASRAWSEKGGNPQPGCTARSTEMPHTLGAETRLTPCTPGMAGPLGWQQDAQTHVAVDALCRTPKCSSAPPQHQARVVSQHKAGSRMQRRRGLHGWESSLRRGRDQQWSPSWGPTQIFANKKPEVVRSSVMAGNPEMFKKYHECRTAHLQGATLIDPQCTLICL